MLLRPLLFAAALPIAAAVAQPPGTGDAPRADDAMAASGAGMDTGKDMAAMGARMRARMMAADADRDGRISRAEWLAMRAAMPARGGGAGGPGGGGAARDPGRMFDRLDANGDGFLDSAEIDALIQRRMARMDGEGDGRATRGERRDTMPGASPDAGAPMPGASPDAGAPDRERHD